MKNFLLFVAFLAVAFAPVFGYAKSGQEKDAVTQEESAQKAALDETVRILNSAESRNQIIQSDPNAKQADAQVEALVGSGQKQKVYELSGKLMEKLVKDAKGDPAKMMELLENAKRDPAAFANGFTAEEKKLLQEIGSSVEKKGHLKQNP